LTLNIKQNNNIYTTKKREQTFFICETTGAAVVTVDVLGIL